MCDVLVRLNAQGILNDCEHMDSDYNTAGKFLFNEHGWIFNFTANNPQE